MKELKGNLLEHISGAAYMTVDYTGCSMPGNASYECMHITFSDDGSLPKEFQDRIDSGASWEEIAPFLTLYSIICELHPELFSA